MRLTKSSDAKQRAKGAHDDGEGEEGDVTVPVICSLGSTALLHSTINVADRYW